MSYGFKSDFFLKYYLSVYDIKKYITENKYGNKSKKASL